MRDTTSLTADFMLPRFTPCCLRLFLVAFPRTLSTHGLPSARVAVHILVPCPPLFRCSGPLQLPPLAFLLLLTNSMPTASWNVQGASGRSDQQDQSTSAAAASKGQEGANGGGGAAAAAAAGVGVKVACTGSKVEALAVDYLKNEVPGDRAIYGQDRLESRGDDVLVEEIGEPEEREMHWQQGELIGAGAFGRVYLGLDLDSGQLMAVKQVSIARDEALRGQVAAHVHSLEAEVMVLKQLHHPNIVRYLGTERVSSDMSSLNIFLEYVPGGSIASLLSKFGSFTESVLRVYTKQILLGLEFLHTHQIMHRDIKGANILVDNTGVVKLADFGASKKIEDLVTMDSGFKSIKGTPYWMAPEVIKQTGHGRQADIWSVGCTVIEMATGKPPWSEFAQPVGPFLHLPPFTPPPPPPFLLSVPHPPSPARQTTHPLPPPSNPPSSPSTLFFLPPIPPITLPTQPTYSFHVRVNAPLPSPPIPTFFLLSSLPSFLLSCLPSCLPCAYRLLSPAMQTTSLGRAK